MSLKIDCPVSVPYTKPETPGRHKEYKLKLSAGEESPGISPPPTTSTTPPLPSPPQQTSTLRNRIARIPENSTLVPESNNSKIEITLVHDENACMSIKSKKMLSLVLLIIGIAALIIGALAFVAMAGVLTGSLAFVGLEMAIGIGIVCKISGLALVMGGGLLRKSTE